MGMNLLKLNVLEMTKLHNTCICQPCEVNHSCHDQPPIPVLLISNQNESKTDFKNWNQTNNSYATRQESDPNSTLDGNWHKSMISDQ